MHRTIIITPSKFSVTIKIPRAPCKRSTRSMLSDIPALSPTKSKRLASIFRNEVEKEKRAMRKQVPAKTVPIAKRLRRVMAISSLEKKPIAPVSKKSKAI